MNLDTGCDQCYAIHIYLDCLASKFMVLTRVRLERKLETRRPFMAWETHKTLVHNVPSKFDFKMT